jgi:hypothetical protein
MGRTDDEEQKQELRHGFKLGGMHSVRVYDPSSLYVEGNAGVPYIYMSAAVLIYIKQQPNTSIEILFISRSDSFKLIY